jgi:hypothetical protein
LQEDREYEYLSEADFESDSESHSESELEPEPKADYDRCFQAAPQDIYDKERMFSGVNVTIHQRFGHVLSKNEKAQALRTETNDERIAGGGSRCVKAVAISLAGK